MLILLAACAGDVPSKDGAPPPPPGDLDIGICAAGRGPFTVEIDNPFLPFPVGAHHALEGLEAGTDFGRFELTVLDETAEQDGVTTRVVEQRSFDEGGLVEVTRAYFAQAPDGSVCFYGEDIDEMADGQVVGQDGWHAGEDGAEAAIYMPAAPEVGQLWTMVYIPPDEVETAEITAVGETVVTPAGTFTDTLTVLEDGPSVKNYARGIGQINDDGMELVEY